MTWDEIDKAFDDLQNRVMPDIINDLIVKHFIVFYIDIYKYPDGWTVQDALNAYFKTGMLIYKP